MLKMAKKLKARAAESERKAAAAAAEVAAEAAVAAAALAEPFASQKNGDPEKPPKSKSVKAPANAGRDVPPEKLLTDKERKKLEKKLLEQRKKEEKKREKERKKLEKMMKKKKKKNVPESQAQARGPEAAAAAAATAGEDEGAAEGAAGLGEGAAVGGASRAWARWDTESGDEDDAYYALPRVGGVVWRPGPAKAGALSAHMPLVMFLVFSVRSPSWVLNFLLQRRTEQGRGCGFVFGATCCFRVFLGCAFFSFLSGRTKRRGRGRGRSRARGTGRRGRDERLI